MPLGWKDEVRNGTATLKWALELGDGDLEKGIEAVRKKLKNPPESILQNVREWYEIWGDSPPSVDEALRLWKRLMSK